MAKKLVSDLVRFSSKLRHDDETGCWVWTAKLDKDGYGRQFKVGSHTDGSRTQTRPHRFIYTTLLEPIQQGLVIDHLCRNRACQNPFHMEPVTPLENTRRGARAQLTHCKYGHPFAGDNLRTASSGQRICKTCARRSSAAHGRQTGWAAQNAYKARKRENENRYG